jgi:hypothetical protein
MHLGAALGLMFDGGKATNRARGFHHLPTPDELRMPSNSTSSEPRGAKVTGREGNNPDQQIRSLSDS